jgi:hypothetical protein
MSDLLFLRLIDLLVLCPIVIYIFILLKFIYKIVTSNSTLFKKCLWVILIFSAPIMGLVLYFLLDNNQRIHGRANDI